MDLEAKIGGINSKPIASVMRLVDPSTTYTDISQLPRWQYSIGSRQEGSILKFNVCGLELKYMNISMCKGVISYIYLLYDLYYVYHSSYTVVVVRY